MGLFSLFSKNKTKTENKKYECERLDRLTKDGNLPYGWYYENRNFTEKIENEHRYFVNAYSDARYKSPKERYAALKSLVQHTEDVRNLCASKGECFVYWSTSYLVMMTIKA